MGKQSKSLHAALAFANSDRKLAAIDSPSRPMAPAKRELTRELGTDAGRIATLQEQLWAAAAVRSSLTSSARSSRVAFT